MAFGRLERRPPAPPMGEINMTPLIDVMLVLLVIFMVTAPLMTGQVKLDLPATEAPAGEPMPGALHVALNAQGEVFVAEAAVPWPQLAERLKAAAPQADRTEVHLRADTAVPYGRVAELMAVLQAQGLNRIAFVTAPQAPVAGR